MTACLQCGKEIPTERRWQRHFCGACNFARYNRNGRSAAAVQVAKAVREGRLQPAKNFACTDCGVPAVEYDHRDYSKPLAVEPVCRKCNSRRGPGKWIQFTPLRDLKARAA